MPKLCLMLLGFLILGCSNDGQEKTKAVPKTEVLKVVESTDGLVVKTPVEEVETKEVVPMSTFTIRLDSSNWIVYNDPADKTQNADTLRLYPDSTYTVNEFAWYFEEKYDEEGAYYWTYEGTYTVEGDLLNLFTQTRRENRNHSTLLVSDTTLQYTNDKSWGGPLRTYLKYDLITPEMKREHKGLRSNLRKFMNADGFVTLNTSIDSVDDVTRIFGDPIETLGSLNERIAQEDPYNTHTCLKYDSLTIQLIGKSLWLYEYSSPGFDIDAHVRIGSLKDSVIRQIGEPRSKEYNVHYYSSDLSNPITHTFVTGTLAAANTEHPYMELQNQLFATITYNEQTDRVKSITFEQIYVKPH